MPTYQESVLESEYREIQRMSEELADDLKNGVQKDYAKMLRNLKYAVAQLYEDYGSQGKLNWDELQKYNRLGKFNKEINGIVKDDMKPAWKRIKGGLQDKSYRDWETDRKSTRLNSSHRSLSRMPSSA